MQSKLIPISYSDQTRRIRLTNYADTVVYDERREEGQGNYTLCAVRFGGYPELVNGMADAIWGGGTVEVRVDGKLIGLKALKKQYHRQKARGGIYAEATMTAESILVGESSDNKEDEKESDAEKLCSDEDDDDEILEELPPRTEYLFCNCNDDVALFEEIDRKTSCPLIPAFQEYLLSELKKRGYLWKLKVLSTNETFDAWALTCTLGDANIIEVVETGLKCGSIAIPGATAGLVTPFQGISSVMGYLNEFGTALGERIKKLFVPLFDPTKEPLSPEVLSINNYIRAYAGYDLYDAQLAVAEAVKRQLERSKVGLIVAECGSGKTKIASTALGALWGLHATSKNAGGKTFNIVLCPSHMTEKWGREIQETLPNSVAATVTSMSEIDRFYQFYEENTASCYMVMSKEQARDGYMRCPSVEWRLTSMDLNDTVALMNNEKAGKKDAAKRRKADKASGGQTESVGEGQGMDKLPPTSEELRIANGRRRMAFCCPECGAPILMPADKDLGYFVDADQFFFLNEHKGNHKCRNCGEPLWTVLNPNVSATTSQWVKIGDYGFVFRRDADKHLERVKNPAVLEKIKNVVENPTGNFYAIGARQAFPLSTYVKRRLKGRVDGLLCDELHQYSQNSGQGDAMNELFQVARKVVGMTATLINGYSSGIFYLLYRITAHLMQRDKKPFELPGKFNSDYGVIQRVYTTDNVEYNSNRRTAKSCKQTRQLPGVSPLVYSRFLMEHTVFLSLLDMGANLPEYEELPVPLDVPENVKTEYDRLESALKTVMKEDRRIAKKILSPYMNLLLAYPDQPYGHNPIYHPIYGDPLVKPMDTASFETMSPKDEALLQIVDKKIAAGEKVLIYTNWTRLDSQQKIKGMMTKRGYSTSILQPTIKPSKRESWVEQHLDKGMQVLITNPSLVETGLDLNAFTTLIFFDTGTKLFTFRQASRRSWRINQKAPRVEVYILYYKDTMQHKMIKLMASKLAVAGVIEGNLSDEGLAAMAESQDMMAIMAKELVNGIKDSVEDVKSMFQRMAVLKPQRSEITEDNNKVERAAPTTQNVPAAAIFAPTTVRPQRKQHVGRANIVSYPFALPEGETRTLLERSEAAVLETWGKRKKNEEPSVLEGQVSLFDGISA